MKKVFKFGEKDIVLDKYHATQGVVSFELGGKYYEFSRVGELWGKTVVQEISGEMRRNGSVVAKLVESGKYHALFDGYEAWIETGKGSSGKKKGGSTGHGAQGHLSPMPGKIFKVLVQVGDKVKKGQVLLVLEAMKMEHSIRAEEDGTVVALPFKLGDLVQGGTQLLELRPEKAS